MFEFLARNVPTVEWDEFWLVCKAQLAEGLLSCVEERFGLLGDRTIVVTTPNGTMFSYPMKD